MDGKAERFVSGCSRWQQRDSLRADRTHSRSPTPSFPINIREMEQKAVKVPIYRRNESRPWLMKEQSLWPVLHAGGIRLPQRSAKDQLRRERIC